MNEIKKFKDKDRPKGKCYDCGISYNDFPDMIIPNDMWELINPTYHKGAGILCPTCMSKRLDQLNLWYKLEVNKKGDEENDKKELFNTLIDYNEKKEEKKDNYDIKIDPEIKLWGYCLWSLFIKEKRKKIYIGTIDGDLPFGSIIKVNGESYKPSCKEGTNNNLFLIKIKEEKVSKKYEHGLYCKDIGCRFWEKTKSGKEECIIPNSECTGGSAKGFCIWLEKHGYKIEKEVE